jgi:hypothetical protein
MHISLLLASYMQRKLSTFNCKRIYCSSNFDTNHNTTIFPVFFNEVIFQIYSTQVLWARNSSNSFICEPNLHLPKHFRIIPSKHTHKYFNLYVSQNCIYFLADCIIRYIFEKNTAAVVFHNLANCR